MNQLTTNIETKYYIDDDEQIYILSELRDNDEVKEFLESNCHMVTRDEIENDIEEIIQDYEESGYGRPHMSWYGVTYYDYEDNLEYVRLQDLLEQLDDAIIIRNNDETYNKFLEEMRGLYAS